MPERRIATVLMLDVVGSTHVAAQLGDVRYRELSSRFNRLVRETLKRHGGREEDHTGDGFFATFPQPDRAIRCASALADSVRTLGVEIRSGIHTGQTESQNGKTHGIAVVIGARVMSLASAGEILVTNTTKELVTGSGFLFEDLSAHELKGVPGTWQVFAVTSVDGEERARPLPPAVAAERLAAIPPPTDRKRPRPRVLIAAALGLLLAIAAVTFAATRGDGSSPPGTKSATPPSGSVVRLDPETGERTTVFVASVLFTAGGAYGTDHGLVVGQGGVWVLRAWVLYHVDPLRAEVRSRISFPASFKTNLAEGLDAVWVVGQTGLYRVNPATDESTLVVRPPGQQIYSPDIAVGAGHVWVSDGTGKLLTLEPGETRGRWRSTSKRVDSLALGHGSVWTIDALAGTVTRLDPDSLRPLSVISITGGGDAIASGDRYVWVLSRSVGALTLIDVDTNTAAQTFRVGDAPTALAGGLGAVWVGDEDGIIRRVDESTLKTTEIPFGARIRAIAVDEENGTLWVDVA